MGNSGRETTERDESAEAEDSSRTAGRRSVLRALGGASALATFVGGGPWGRRRESECGPECEAFQSFFDRIGEHRDEQQRQSEAELTTVYLIRVQTYYALEAMELDAMISH